MDKIEKNYKPLIIVSILLVVFTIIVLIIYRDVDDTSDKYELDNEFLRNYKVNEAIPITINDEKMARIYLAEYISLLFDDPQRAYELLDGEYKNKKYPTYESFMKYVDLIRSEQLSKATLLKYDIKVQNGYKVYDLYDISNHNFVFRESSIMNYSVMLDNYTIY